METGGCVGTLFPLMIPGAESISAPVPIMAPYDGAEIAVVATTDTGAVNKALDTAYGIYRD